LKVPTFQIESYPELLGEGADEGEDERCIRLVFGVVVG
jgi:hypothetical protein